jgi:hypothetical protein
MAGPRARRAARAPACAASGQERCARCGAGRRTGGSDGAAAATSAAPPTGSESPGRALIDEIDSFWHTGSALSDLHVNPFAVEATDALLRQLGPAPVDVGGENLVEFLTPIYRVLAEQAERRALE